MALFYRRAATYDANVTSIDIHANEGLNKITGPF
jgi:hypothetical protein